MKYYTIATEIGSAAAANAFLTGTKVNVAAFVVGDGGGAEYEPSPDMTELRNEVWRGVVANAQTDPHNPNVIHYTALLPSAVGGFVMREMGILDDRGRLIGVGNMASTPKLCLDQGISDETELTFSLAIASPGAMEWSVDPTVILASKRDIASHNRDGQAHPDLQEKLSGKADKKWFSRENLLINWWFGPGLVNQRGQAEYAAAGYTIDGWYNTHSAGTVKIESDHLRWTQSGNYSFYQKLENPTRLNGRTLTASCLGRTSREGFGSMGIRVVRGAESHLGKTAKLGTDYGVASATLELSGLQENDELQVYFVVNNSETPVSLELKAVKLELGDTQTLAHREADGGWTLNDPPPNPQQALARCQRYFIRRTGNYQVVGAGVAQSQDWFLGTIFGGENLRADPRIDFSDLYFLGPEGGSGAIRVIGHTATSNAGKNYMTFSGQAGLDPGKTYLLQIRTDTGYFDMDANL